MNDNIERGSGVEVLAGARPLNAAFLAFTSSISLGLRRVRAVLGRSWPRPGEHEQVIGEHPQPNPSLHATSASISASSESVTALECADTSFAAGAPAEGRSSKSRALLARLARQHDVPDPALQCRPLIAPGREAAVGDHPVRGVIEERDVPIQG